MLGLLAGFLFHFLFLSNSFLQFACLAGSLCFDITWFVSLRFYNLCASPARLGLLLGSSLFVFTIYVPRHLAWVYFLDRPYSFLQTACLPCSLSFTPWIVPIRFYSLSAFPARYVLLLGSSHFVLPATILSRHDVTHACREQVTAAWGFHQGPRLLLAARWVGSTVPRTQRRASRHLDRM